jgi:hypothetical protein
MLTWEGEAILGVQNIITKLNVSSFPFSQLRKTFPPDAPLGVVKQGLPFEKVAHKILTVDPQPSSNNSANLLVLVTGQLLVDDSPAPMPYSQMFQVGRLGG